MRLGLVDVIGHITPASTGCYLVTPDGQDIKKAEGTRVPGRISVLPPPAADGYSERERQMAVGPLRTGVTQRDAQPVPSIRSQRAASRKNAAQSLDGVSETAPSAVRKTYAPPIPAPTNNAAFGVRCRL